MSEETKEFELNLIGWFAVLSDYDGQPLGVFPDEYSAKEYRDFRSDRDCADDAFYQINQITRKIPFTE
jgi:hypothetical protein